MSTPTTNMALGKGVDTDNAKTYLETTLGAALDTLDAHDHSTNAKGLPVQRGVNLVVASGGLQVTLGNVGVGVPASASVGVLSSGTLTTATSQYGVQSNPTGNSSATTELAGFLSNPATAAAAFTATTVVGFHALTPSKGVGSSITNAAGLLVDAFSVGGTENIGVKIGQPTGGAAGNNLAILARGDSLVGNTTNAQLGTTATAGFLFIDSCGGAPTGVPAGYGNGQSAGGVPMIYDTTNNKIWFYAGAWRGVVVA